MLKKIYLAGPLGFSEAGRKFMYEELVPLIEKAGFEVLDPWKLTDEGMIQKALKTPYGEEKRKEWEKVNLVIGKNNADAIEECDGVVAVLDGTDVDSGTASEIGFAAALGKKVLGYRGDFRMCCDNEGSLVNLQVEYFIKLHGGKSTTSMEELAAELDGFLK